MIRTGLVNRQIVRGAPGVTSIVSIARRSAWIQCNAMRGISGMSLSKFKAAPVRRVSAKAPRAISRRTLSVNALFEKFTERSIKSIMLGQQAAKVGKSY